MVLQIHGGCPNPPKVDQVFCAGSLGVSAKLSSMYLSHSASALIPLLLEHREQVARWPSWGGRGEPGHVIGRPTHVHSSTLKREEKPLGHSCPPLE